MLKDLFEFVKNELLEFIGHDPQGVDESVVNFVDHSVDPPVFNAKVNLFMINMEEEKVMRPPDRYIQLDEDGKEQRSNPPLMLNIYMLIAFKPSGGNPKDFNYGDTLQNLSKVIQFFQSNPFITPAIFPALPEGLGQLSIELNPLTYSQQNEIWSALKRAYLPSLCYKIRMLTYTGDIKPQVREVGEFSPNVRGT